MREGRNNTENFKDRKEMINIFGDRWSDFKIFNGDVIKN